MADVSKVSVKMWYLFLGKQYVHLKCGSLSCLDLNVHVACSVPKNVAVEKKSTTTKKITRSPIKSYRLVEIISYGKHFTGAQCLCALLSPDSYAQQETRYYYAYLLHMFRSSCAFAIEMCASGSNEKREREKTKNEISRAELATHKKRDPITKSEHWTRLSAFFKKRNVNLIKWYLKFTMASIMKSPKWKL